MRRPNFRGAGGRVAGFVPTDLDNLVLWLPHDSQYVTLNGSDVSASADQSGEGNHATQTDPSFQPLWNSSDAAFGGKPTITYDAANGEHLRADGVAQYQNGDDLPFSFWVVASFSGSGTRTFFEFNDGSIDDLFTFRLSTSDQVQVLRFRSGTQLVETGDAVSGGKAVYSLHFTGTAVTVRRNGAAVGMEGVALDTSAHVDFSEFAIGAHSRGPGNGWDGTMTEPTALARYLDPDGDEASSMTERLAAEYEITL